MRILTGRYSAHRLLAARGDLAKVCITYDKPDQMPYDLDATLYLLAPSPTTRKRSEVVNRLAYRGRLSIHGVRKIRGALLEISERVGGKDIVLLAHEDTATTYSHRDWFADWWETETGEAVSELTEETEIDAKFRQSSLF
jgi:hypothetical protein